MGGSVVDFVPVAFAGAELFGFTTAATGTVVSTGAESTGADEFAGAMLVGWLVAVSAGVALSAVVHAATRRTDPTAIESLTRSLIFFPLE